MRVLIIGATGLVGHSLWRSWREREGWEVSGAYHDRAVPGLDPLDILDPKALKEALERVRPEAVVMAASNPHVDFCETHAQETRRINVEAVLGAAKTAAGARAKFVFFSSDYVFDGTEAPYVESASVRPINEYGRQKVEAEQGIARETSKHLILRISGAFGWELARKNFVLQILDRAKAGQPIHAAKDVVYHPTYAPNLAPVLAELLESDAAGIYHTTCPDELSRYEFAVAAAEAFGLDPKIIEPATLASLSAAARRPPHSSLRSERLPPQAREQLRDSRKALAHMRRTQPEWEGYLKTLDVAV